MSIFNCSPGSNELFEGKNILILISVVFGSIGMAVSSLKYPGPPL